MKEWNGQIIVTSFILVVLLTFQTSVLASVRETHPGIKWIITATLMQSATPSKGSKENGTSPSSPNTRGVFVAQGAWWDEKRDGTKSFDFWDDASYGGVDVTVCVTWCTV